MIDKNADRQYQVVKRHGKWCTKTLGRFSVPYSNQDKAVQASIGFAQLVWITGRNATVTLFVRDRVPEIVWTGGCIVERNNFRALL